MPRLSTDARRAQLLASGRSVFAGSSYDAVSVDDLAAAAGVSKGLLYHYFPDKRAFYQEVLRRSALDVLEVTAPEPTGPAHVALHDALRRFVAYVSDNAAFYRSLVRGGVGSDGAVEALVEDVRQQTMARVLARLDLPATDAVSSTVYGWVGFVEFTVLDWLARRHLPAEALARRLVLALIQLLQPAESP